ncbi:MAG: hypothetical protein ACK4S8_14615, partial [Alishewanella aestuarii]
RQKKEEYFQKLVKTFENFAKISENWVIEWGGIEIEYYEFLLDAIYSASFKVKDVLINSPEPPHRARTVLHNKIYTTHSLAFVCIPSGTNTGLTKDQALAMTREKLTKIIKVEQDVV